MQLKQTHAKHVTLVIIAMDQTRPKLTVRLAIFALLAPSGQPNSHACRAQKEQQLELPSLLTVLYVLRQNTVPWALQPRLRVLQTLLAQIARQFQIPRKTNAVTELIQWLEFAPHVQQGVSVLLELQHLKSAQRVASEQPLEAKIDLKIV